jgi:hypothetical protein
VNEKNGQKEFSNPITCDIIMKRRVNMEEVKAKSSVLRVTELGNREATVLEQDLIRVVISDAGGMIPELSSPREQGRINAHWLPWFRGTSGNYKDSEHGAFWKAKLLYQITGNFCCAPNFGPGHIIDEVNMPPHGWTANETWRYVNSGTDCDSGAAWVLSTMEAPPRTMPLSFKKIDMVIPGQPIHYASMAIKNHSNKDIEICAGWHNTVGAPFLQAGCRISGAAHTWVTPPLGGEFDDTTRLVMGAEFSALEKTPLAKGGVVDISVVPGPIGYTDFASGAIPRDARMGWSALVNPTLKMAYICFFTGPKDAAADDIILYFNELWMQYGGRPFTPWALYDGGADLTYCLGTENAVSAYAYGLEYSRQAHRILGSPTTVTIPAGEEKTLRYGTLFAPYSGEVLDNGVKTIETEAAALIAAGKNGQSHRFNADPEFTLLRKVAASM